MNDFLSKYGGGQVVDCSSEEAIFMGLKEFYASWKNETMQDYPSTTLFDTFSARKVLDTYEKLFYGFSTE
jgi:hypothetical protein